jgi:hypothetical protein
LYVTHGGLVHGVVADTHDDWQPRTASGLPAKLRIGDDTPFRLRMHVLVVVVVPVPQVTEHCDGCPRWQEYAAQGCMVQAAVVDVHEPEVETTRRPPAPLQPWAAAGMLCQLGTGVEMPFSNFMHVLIVVVVPVPQVTEQAEGCPRWQEYAAQGCMVHEALVDWQPLQATAACGMLCQLGTGMIWPFSDLTHWLVVVVMPLPHVTEHCEGCPRWQE